ncbi:MAG: Smr/MutS family protein [Alphaproteobacteria bacterium]|jgi:DNA-nicking Smr family endonuclease|nr:Smr/MutS family protein [Alphaproteobacteria bacterium]
MARSRASHWPSDEDLDLFHKVVADVTPLRPEPTPAKSENSRKPAGGSDKRAGSVKKPKTIPGLSKVENQLPSVAFPAALADHGAGRTPGLDKRTAQRLQRGKTEIDGRIDLHGMTQAEARSALTGFVTNGHRHDRRCLLVITGKGRRPGDREDRPWGDDGRSEPGVLRRMVPRWLKEAPLADRVLAYSPAQPKHGGSGALYVLLKRRRSP